MPLGGEIDPDHAGVVQVQQVGQDLVGVESVPVDEGPIGGQRPGQLRCHIAVGVRLASGGELSGLEARSAQVGAWSASQRAPSPMKAWAMASIPAAAVACRSPDSRRRAARESAANTASAAARVAPVP